MAPRIDDMQVLAMAREQGLINDSQYEVLREEHTRIVKGGRHKTATRIAIEKGILSEGNAKDLQTEVWIRSLPTHLDNYQVVRLIGRGGMAVVFEAQDVSLGKVVALKILLPEFSTSDSYLSRFHREARIAAKLTHPNAVQVFAAGRDEDIEYLVMEYVEGETLSAIIKDRGRIPEEEALDMLIGLTGALEEASGMGIVHRDIKPGNIMLSKWDVAKLSDFGIAKEFSDIPDPKIQVSLTMGVVGTPTYMSPEQAKGARQLDLRSDIYSLGTTLYHMVVGDIPFLADTPQETMFRVVSEAPRPPRSAYPDLSEQTAAIICKMMAKDPDHRYNSYEALRSDLIAAREERDVSITYEDAIGLLRPGASPAETAADYDEDEAPTNLLRMLAVAVAVVLIAMVLFSLAKGCPGP